MRSRGESPLNNLNTINRYTTKIKWERKLICKRKVEGFDKNYKLDKKLVTVGQNTTDDQK